jgi:hypothetical protein
MRAGAADGRDAYDFSHAPPPPGGYATISFLTDGGAPLLADWRAIDREGQRWAMELRTDQVGRGYRVQLAPEQSLPEGWILAAIDDDGRELTDVTGGGALSGPVPSTSTRRSWTLAAGSRAYVETVQNDVRVAFDASITDFAFSPPIPRPVRRGQEARFEFRLPVATRAIVEIFDVAGRHVATPLDPVLERGAHDVMWNGRDGEGRFVAAGGR